MWIFAFFLFALPSLGVLQPQVATADNQIIFPILLGTGFVEFLLALFMRKFLFRPKRESGHKPNVPSILRVHFSACVVGMALSLSPSVIGLVIFILGGDLQWSRALSLLSLIGLYLVRPNEDLLRAKLVEVEPGIVHP